MMKSFSPVTNQPQLTACVLLDGGRDLAKLARLLAQTGVFGPGVRQGGLKHAILLPRPDHGQQPLLADERVGAEDTPDEEDHAVERAAVAVTQDRV